MADAPSNKSTWTAYVSSDLPVPSGTHTFSSFLKSIATFTGDLSALTAPSFILSGTSILEYSAYWAEHPQLLLDIQQDDAEARMLACVKWYCATLKGQFSARHESSGGEKKPLNPVLGEEFHGSWTIDGKAGGTVNLTAEQVSHHPPISSYRIAAPNGITLQGHNGQKSGFSGRTIVVKQIGHAVLQVPFQQGQKKETILITLPQLVLEGLLYGAPYAELTEKSYIAASSGWTTVFEYSGAGWLSGKKHTLKAKIYPPQAWEQGEPAKHVVEGQWTDTLTIRSQSSKASDSDSAFVETHTLPRQPISVKQVESPYDSRKLWAGVAKALKEQDFEQASKLKSEIENAQRQLRMEEKEAGKGWTRKYFEKCEALEPEVQRLADKVKLPDTGYWSYKGKG